MAVVERLEVLLNNLEARVVVMCLLKQCIFIINSPRPISWSGDFYKVFIREIEGERKPLCWFSLTEVLLLILPLQCCGLVGV